MNSQEIIEQPASYTVHFHESFFDAFGKASEEIDSLQISADVSNKKIDAIYLAKLILNGNLIVWMGIANHQRPLDSDNERLQNLYQDLCAYIANRDFTIEDFSEKAREFQGIIDYFVEKFSKTSLTQEKTRQQTNEILVPHK